MTICRLINPIQGGCPMPETKPSLRLAVLGAKGGCGRSTVAINLAYLLATAGRQVALVDLAQFGSLIPLLHQLPLPGTGFGSIAACLRSLYRHELPTVLQTALLPLKLGRATVSLLGAAAPQRQDDLPIADLLVALQSLTDLGYDLVLDTSHELSDRLAAALHTATHRLWVLTPDPTAGWHTLQALEIARQLSVPQRPEGLLVNRYHRRCGLNLKDLQTAVNLSLWGLLPDMPKQLPLAAHRGVPLLAHRSGPWQRQLLGILGQMDLAPEPSRWPWSRKRREQHGQV